MLPVSEFERKCKEDIRKNTSLPAKNWLVINHESIRICWIELDTKKIRYLNFTKEEAARFLVKNGIIYLYTMEGDQVKLFIKCLLTVTGPKGEPVQYIRTVELPWNELKDHIYQSDVIKFAVNHVYQEKGSILGLVARKAKAKVINITNNIHRAA